MTQNFDVERANFISTLPDENSSDTCVLHLKQGASSPFGILPGNKINNIIRYNDVTGLICLSVRRPRSTKVREITDSSWNLVKEETDLWDVTIYYNGQVRNFIYPIPTGKKTEINKFSDQGKFLTR